MEADKKFPMLRTLAQAIEVVGYVAGLIILVLGVVLAFASYAPGGIKIVLISGSLIIAGLLLIACLLAKEMISVALAIEYNTRVGCLWSKALAEKFDVRAEKRGE